MMKKINRLFSRLPSPRGLAMAIALLAAGRAYGGTTYYVSASGDDGFAGISEEAPFATLRKAIATANGDPAAEAVVVLSDLVLDAPVELTGPYSLRGRTGEPAMTTIAAEEKTKVTPLVKVSHPDASVAHLTLSGGTATETSGGNLWLNGGGTVTNCILRDATGQGAYGGGLRNDDGLVTHCIIEGNKLFGGSHGAGLSQSGPASVTEHSVIRNNTLNDYLASGGGVFITQGTLRHCVVTNNASRFELGHGGQGGGIYAKGALLDHCLIAGNRAGAGGGGIYFETFRGKENGVDVTRTTSISNCTIVCNSARDNAGAIACKYSIFSFVDSIVWGNRAVFRVDPARWEFFLQCPANVPIENILSETPVGAGHLQGDPLFRDPAHGDFSLTALSPAIGTGADGGDLGWKPFDRTAFSVGLSSLPAKPLVQGGHRFHALARGGTGEPRYRWRLDDLATAASGEWSDWTTATNRDLTLSPGHFRMTVEAEDGEGAVASFSRVFYVGAKKVFLVPAGTAGNSPAAPFETKETAANDVREAILYCADGTELVVADGDYGVTDEIFVPARVLIRSENGPAKTSFYRIGPFGKGTPSRVVHLRGGGAVLSGFAVTNGFSGPEVIAKYGCNVILHENDVVTNCIISKAFHNGGAAAIAAIDGKVLDTIVRDNKGGGGTGGGVSLRGAKCLMADCVVSNHVFNNFYTHGQGVWANGATIERCVIRDNWNNFAGNGGCGGGAYLIDATIRDSVICDNGAGQHGGGGLTVEKSARVENCTIANNKAATAGGLRVFNNASSATIVNTIFHGNEASAPTTSRGEPTWTMMDNGKCSMTRCSVPVESAKIGEDNLVLPSGPYFVDAANGDYRLALNSPCRDIGLTGERTAEELDVVGVPRVIGPAIDIGAYEFSLPDDLACSFVIRGNDTVGQKVTAIATADGNDLAGLEYRWHYRDASGGPASGWTYWTSSPTNDFELAAGRYRFTLEVRNAAGQMATSDDGTIYDIVSAEVYLVPPEKATGAPLYPYDSWERAATNVPTAFLAAGNGTTIRAAAGDYPITEGIVVDKRIRLESVAGPEKTSIYRDFPRTDRYPSFRPVTLSAPGSVLAGFTVSNSIVHTEAFNGAAVYCRESTVSNCVFSHNRLHDFNQGATVMNVDGLVADCRFHDNRGGAGDGFGLCQRGEKARAVRCEFYHNSVGIVYGHGAVVLHGGVVVDCVVTGNVISAGCGHTAGIEVLGGLAYDCLVGWNRGGAAGGAKVFNGALVNCTIVSNAVESVNRIRAGGLVFETRDNRGDLIGVTNCIVHGNWNPSSDGSVTNAMEAAILPGVVVSLSHTLLENWERIDPAATGCLSGDPLFADPAGRDWRLGKESPCRDAGLTLDFMRGGVDLDGRPRVDHLDRVDLGCYESTFHSLCTLLMLR